ncbi:MAG TPA: peptidoglycan DD-metalloendopeptidase family protein [Fimbriimonadaceae bacterium]|nr:peptidoglycan DD-metalloendopeptidase family protein [Fimbriimonadaceae bacterium]HRJ32467.1 peptidoglycan DD-metalloendopeptidase family protein [Fimbriimonadaceae bacterium]
MKHWGARGVVWGVVILFVLWGASLADAQSSSKSKSKTKSSTQLQREMRNVQSQKQKIQKQIQAKRREARAVMGDIQEVDGRLGHLEGRIEETSTQLSKNVQTQRKLASEVTAATQRLNQKRKEVRERLKQMYVAEEENVAVALLKARDLGDLAGRKTIIEKIAAKDRKLFDEVDQLQKSIVAKKAQQDRVVANIRDLKSRQVNYQGELKSARSNKAQLLGELQAQQAELRKEYDELDRESDALAAQIRSLQASRRGTRQEVSPYRGSFQRPVSGRITSGFGMRFHPILKQNRMHNGIDFAAPTGTPIVSVAPGVVLSAGYRRGYGNTVVIDHGGGMSTLYAHCSRLFVSEGQRVTRGQRIAAVGSTGLSTGPHLHFEVRIDGRPVDPRRYL